MSWARRGGGGDQRADWCVGAKERGNETSREFLQNLGKTAVGRGIQLFMIQELQSHAEWWVAKTPEMPKAGLHAE
jgi:hypothetical protein